MPERPTSVPTPRARDWDRYVAEYHDARPGITEDVLADARDDRGRSPYDWLVEAVPPVPMEVSVKIRYAHGGAAATVEPLVGDRALVRLREPQRAVTPGQAAVFYDAEDRVLGGGWICRHVAAADPRNVGLALAN